MAKMVKSLNEEVNLESLKLDEGKVQRLFLIVFNFFFPSAKLAHS